MRTVLTESAAAGRNDLHAILVPAGRAPELPDAAPPASAWRSDFGDDAGTQLVLRSGTRRWLLLRLPKAKEAGAEDVRGAAGSARAVAEELQRSHLVMDLGLLADDEGLAQAAAEGAGMAGYDPGVLKKERDQAKVKKISVTGMAVNAAMRRAVKRGQLGAEANLFARELQNLPANVLTPKDFARRARKECGRSEQLSCKVLGRKRIEELKMGLLLGVTQGSALEPQVVHMSYKPKGKPKGRIALVGKGLTFDAGGISLKPPPKMEDMKFDMSGAAAVLGVFHALAGGAECAYEVHGVLGCVENMPGGKAQRPGDIRKGMNGTSVEVHNTDAEGRLVLADCLTYTARRIKPDRIYDMATLTGAAIVSLGHLRSAVIGTDQEAIDEMVRLSEECGEACWQLPIDEEYRDLTRGTYADLQNIYAPGQGAGTIAGACFLSFFVDDVPWVHLDIAATAWEGPSRSYMSKGGRGVIARTMLEVLRG